MASIRFISAEIGGGKSLYATGQILAELKRSDRYIITNVPLILSLASNVERLQTLAQALLAAKRAEKDFLRRQQKKDLYWTIQEYCQVFCDRPIDVARRVIYLSEERALEFWRYVPMGEDTPERVQRAKELFLEEWRDEEDPKRPSFGYKLPNVEHKQYGSVPDFRWRQGGTGFPNGCYYVLDEVHQLFPARFWQKSGPQVERYMSQLRKLNDDLDLITQHPDKVDANFRRNATEWVKVQNMSKTRLFMGVTLDKKFRVHTYQGQEMPTRFTKPTFTGWYYLDGAERTEWLYETMMGVGVSGGMVSEESRFKGRSPLVWVMVVPILLILAWTIPKMLEKGAEGAVTVGLGSITKGTSSAMGHVVPATPPPASFQPPALSPAQTPAAVPGSVRPIGFPRSVSSVPRAWLGTSPLDDGPGDVFCKGVFTFPDGQREVFLSDGRVAYSNRGEVQDVGLRAVKVFGYTQPILRKDTK